MFPKKCLLECSSLSENLDSALILATGSQSRCAGTGRSNKWKSQLLKRRFSSAKTQAFWCWDNAVICSYSLSPNLRLGALDLEFLSPCLSVVLVKLLNKLSKIKKHFRDFCLFDYGDLMCSLQYMTVILQDASDRRWLQSFFALADTWVNFLSASVFCIISCCFL